MARAAVRAKQAEAAAAHAAANSSRRQRKHAAGGNPNQDLFFTRLRRRQKWVFAALATVFAVSFVFLGVGSGAGSGLQGLYNGIFGGGGDSVGKAKAEINKNPTKGYQDLANAYLAKSDVTDAIGALKSYLNLKKKDSAVWGELGGYENTQGQTAYQQYQQVAQAGQLQAPGTLFQPTGALEGQFGKNPIDEYYQQQTQSQTQPLLSQAFSAYGAALTAYQNAAKYAPPATRGELLLTVYSAAQLAGNQKAELQALKQYVQITPNAPNLKSIEKACQKLGGSCKPQQSK
jgi:hypothetical protein